MPESCDEFLEEFVAPFVGGGEMKIGDPIDGPKIERFVRELPQASVGTVMVDDSRKQILQEVVVVPPIQFFGEDELYLAAAVYNLLFLAHPELDSSRVRGKVISAAKSFASRELSLDRGQTLGRYALLANLYRVVRTDTELRWWTGKATFQGMSVPARLTRWRNVRRVQESESQVGYQELYAGADASAILGILVRRSPLTQLLAPPEVRLHLHWESVVFLLHDAEMCRCVAYACVHPQDESRNPLEQICRYAAEFEQMLERRPSSSDVRAVAAFLIHLNCLLAFGKAGAVNTQQLHSALVFARRPRGLATFVGLPAAATQLKPDFIPSELSADSEWHARFLEWQDMATKTIGKPFVDSLAGRLQRHFGGVIDSAGTEDHGSSATE